MPLYDFKCTACDNEVELRVSMDAQPRCDKCGAEMARKPSYFGSYSIKGNNSASQTPKKFRGGR